MEGDLSMDRKNYDLAVKLRHELHEHPELANQEVWTKAHLIEFLQEHSSLKIVDRGRWFYAVYTAGADRKNIAFRADIDALPQPEYLDIPYASRNPGVSHKCGHEGHAASLAGFALEVDQHGADHNVYFLFQHAEETGDGAAEAAVFIEENKIDEIFGYHNMNDVAFKAIGVREGIIFSPSSGLVIHMEGTPSHASMPETGRNPAFAIAQLVNSLSGLTAADQYTSRVLCSVIQIAVGKRAFGSNASAGDLLLTVRATYEADLESLMHKIEELARQLAARDGLKLSFEYVDAFPETRNHPESNAKIRQAAENLSLDLVELEDPIRSSDDYGYYTKLTAGAYFLIGNGRDYPAVHTKEYDFRDELIAVASDMFRELLRLE
jgi:amidohydrolase